MATKNATKLPERRKPGVKLGQQLVDDPRVTTLHMRFNSAELASLEALAKRLKSTRSAAIRHAIQKAVEGE